MSHAGRLLVATPLIGDPNFERTVVALLAHDRETGAFGLVLNRPSDMLVRDVTEGWDRSVAAPGVVFFGGPVDTESLIGLARGGSGDDRFAPLVGELGTIDLARPPGDEHPPWFGLRLFLGSAGWGPGQLEAEISDGAWWVVDAAPDDIATGDPDGLWGRVVRRQSGRLAWFANCPLDPTAN
ncbi:MAG: YqgE/AlgH family protein [Acidimicrobiales bacterium]|nr:YqgE/AlgH family protein [Acidimicrobiales bacterium]